MLITKNWVRSWTRSEAIAAVFTICFLNGIVTRVQSYTDHYGIEAGLTGLFGISALVLICFYLALENVLRGEERPLNLTDVLFFTFVVIANLVASPVVSWLSLSTVALREYLRSGQDRNVRRGAALMIGLTMPMFWGRLVFALASSTILKADAFLVSLMTSSQQSGNVVALSNGGGYVWIADACSSFGNISLAMLCWLMFMEYRGRPERTLNDYVVCLFACINIVIVNVTRIALIVKRPDLYELLHGPYGATIAGYISTLLVLAVCSSGIKRAPKLAV